MVNQSLCSMKNLKFFTNVCELCKIKNTALLNPVTLNELHIWLLLFLEVHLFGLAIEDNFYFTLAADKVYYIFR